MAWKSAPRTAVRAAVSERLGFEDKTLMEDTRQDPCVLDRISHRPDHQLQTRWLVCTHVTWRLRREDLKLEVSLSELCQIFISKQQKSIHSGLLGVWLSGNELA